MIGGGWCLHSLSTLLLNLGLDNIYLAKCFGRLQKKGFYFLTFDNKEQKIWIPLTAAFTKITFCYLWHSKNVFDAQQNQKNRPIEQSMILKIDFDLKLKKTDD